jgi:hypothetical protein
MYCFLLFTYYLLLYQCRRVSARWPDYLILDASVWHLYKGDRLSQYERQMEHLLNVVRVRVPPHTQVFWLSPPARGSLRQHYRLGLPADWVPIYARVAGDLGFFVPQGPAIHLDQLSIGFGEPARLFTPVVYRSCVHCAAAAGERPAGAVRRRWLAGHLLASRLGWLWQPRNQCCAVGDV